MGEKHIRHTSDNNQPGLHGKYPPQWPQSSDRSGYPGRQQYQPSNWAESPVKPHADRPRDERWPQQERNGYKPRNLDSRYARPPKPKHGLNFKIRALTLITGVLVAANFAAHFVVDRIHSGQGLNPFGGNHNEGSQGMNGNEFSDIDPQYHMKGPPTVSENGFVAVLQQGNPHISSQTARSIYEMLKAKGIDPGFELAVFQAESNFGTTGLAKQTMNACNIRAWPGIDLVNSPLRVVDQNGSVMDPNDPAIYIVGYADFSGFGANPSSENKGKDAWWHSFDACSNDVIGIMTTPRYDANGKPLPPITKVDQLAPVLAPASDDNDPSQYAANIEQFMVIYNRISREIAEGKRSFNGYPSIMVDGVPLEQILRDEVHLS